MKRLVFITIFVTSFSIISAEAGYAQLNEITEKIICSECGLENSDDGLFCAGCGIKLVQPPEQSPTTKTLDFDQPVFTPDPDDFHDDSVPTDLNADNYREIISNMSRQDLIRLVELLTEKSYHKPVKLDPNLVSSMTRVDLERMLRTQTKPYVTPKLNGFQKFLQVVGFITTMSLIIVLLA